MHNVRCGQTRAVWSRVRPGPRDGTSQRSGSASSHDGAASRATRARRAPAAVQSSREAREQRSGLASSRNGAASRAARASRAPDWTPLQWRGATDAVARPSASSRQRGGAGVAWPSASERGGNGRWRGAARAGLPARNRWFLPNSEFIVSLCIG